MTAFIDFFTQPTNLALVITLAAVVLLGLALWRRGIAPLIRAVLTVIAATALSFGVTGSVVSVGFLAVDVLLIVIMWLLARAGRLQGLPGIGWIGLLLIVLIGAKLPQVQSLTGPAAWVGISYLTFRLIHIVLDSRNSKLNDATLPETVVYALHPATLIAGPIDRLQHSTDEQRCERAEPDRYVADGIWRIFVGVFKKVALGNVCYLFITSHDITKPPNNQYQGVAWLWLVIYSFYIYFDFAGYSDIAIGIARLMGMRLPENFANPYVQPTITRFWQAWHITLSTWLRDYLFFPISRGLLKRFGSRFSAPILFISHMTTMLLCGLWHGIGGGFAVWGLWHGFGLFIHSQFVVVRRRFNLPAVPTVFGVALTYGFVMLGWVFFSHNLPDSVGIFRLLFGVNH